MITTRVFHYPIEDAGGPPEPPTPTRACTLCGRHVPEYLFGSYRDMGGACPYCDEPLGREKMPHARTQSPKPVQKIEEEDVQTPRVVRHLDDVVVVLDNPKVGRVLYPNDRSDDQQYVRPEFGVSPSKGFQVYVDTAIFEDGNNPDGEPVFRGMTSNSRCPTPDYRIRVTL